MSGFYFTFRSQTAALRAARALELAGIDCRVVRAPRAISRKGCGYCVFVSTELVRAKIVLAQQKAAWHRIYLQHPDGIWEEADGLL